jgi:hypothetical protein
MQHMYSHADKYLSEAKMSPAQRVNFRADKLATAGLTAAVEANEFISSIFPSEKSALRLPGNRLRGPQKCNH